MAEVKLDPNAPLLAAESAPWSIASLKRLFREYQMTNVTYADDAYKTIHKGRFEKFSIILVGDGLEKGDSVKVISQIRSEGKNTKVPIIFLCQENDENTSKEAMEAGASKTLNRPVEERALREAIEEVLDRYILTATMVEELDQENKSATMSVTERGQKLLALGDLEGAEAAFEEAMMTGGDSADVFCGLAEVYLARGDKEAADQVLVEAVRVDPLAREKFDSRNMGLIRRGKEFLEKGNFEKAQDALEEALLKGGDLLEVYASLAEVQLIKNDREAAERAIAEAEKIDPNIRERFKKFEDELVAKGEDRLDNEKFLEAKNSFECAVCVNENSVAGNIGLGRSLKALGEKEAAEAAFQRALDSDERPGDLHVYNKMGISARKDKEFKIALDSYDRAISYDPEDAILYYNKAMVYVAQTKFEECLELLETALQYNPEFVEASGARDKIQRMMKK